ncbi:MAG: protein kinase [candidate division Zixibacteria bacterium]|nr:protein kinase [candidate division Zixibacteria bacterium]
MTEATQEKQSQSKSKKHVKIGNYVVTGKIGQGGVAIIYKGYQASLDRDVAIKVLSPRLTDDPDIVRRFERESMVVARLNHPNIVNVIDKGKAGDRYYFVMNYIKGTSLREVIDSEKIPLKTKLDMIVQVCKALDYAHKNGVIHRDIKPANILIDKEGNALVADFGIAQIIGTPEGEMTSSDVVMGTVSYMSPEQKVSSTNVDQTTDIYAMGMILYEILCGKKPLGHFKLPSQVIEDLDTRYDDIILRCLAQEPNERFETAVELKNAILDIIGGDGYNNDPNNMLVSGAESFLGKCRYLDTIRETKFSSTILVENRVNKKLYVIKNHSKGESGRKEAKLLSSLKHKNIINILGAGGDKKKTVVISAYAQGGSLADRMVRRYKWEHAIKIIIQVASGLDFAHKNKIVHGNLRPSNILFDENENVKLSDFGLPVHYTGPRKKNWYSPPERKKSRIGDIYGMGVVLHQMILGRNPGYDSGNRLIFDDERDDIPKDVKLIINKMLAIRVSQRYQTAEEFILEWEDFNRNRKEEIILRETKPVVEVKPVKKVPIWAVMLVGFGVLAGILIAFYLSGFFR